MSRSTPATAPIQMSPKRTPQRLSLPSYASRSPPRSSRFIEGPPTTLPLSTTSHTSSLLPQPPTLLLSILSEQDAAESKRKSHCHQPQHHNHNPPHCHQHTTSSSSSSSFLSSSSTNGSIDGLRIEDYARLPIEGQRSVNFGSGEARRSIDGWVRGVGGGEEGLKRKFRGRFRALTAVGRNGDVVVKPYEGT